MDSWSNYDRMAALRLTEAMRAAQQTQTIRRLRGLYGTGASIIATDPVTGAQTIDDGAGNIVINNPDGSNYRLQMNLANKVAWMQPPVYIAVGVGAVLGFLAMAKFSRRK